MEYFINTTNLEALRTCPLVWTVDHIYSDEYEVHADKDQAEALAELPGVSIVTPGKMDLILTVSIPAEAIERLRAMPVEELRSQGILRLEFQENQQQVVLYKELDPPAWGH